MDYLSSKELKQLLERILKRMSCPACYNRLRPPVAVCESGHATCSECKGKTSTCQLCSKSIMNMKIRQLDEALEAIPHFCRFDGCKALVKADDDHEKWCGYRMTDCKIDKCDWKGCVKLLTKHIFEDHKSSTETKGSSIPNLNDTTYVEWKYIEYNKLCTRNASFYYPVVANSQFLWQHITSDLSEKMVKVAFYCIPFENYLHSLKVTFTLKNDNKTYSTSIVVPPEHLTNEEENCIRLPFSIVLNLVGKDGYILWETMVKNELSNDKKTAVIKFMA